MTSSRAAVVLGQPVAVVVGVLTSFALFNDAFRQLETVAAAGLLHLAGVPAEQVQVRPGSSLGVYPAEVSPFLAVVTPSCSSLASVLAIAFLAVFVPRSPGRRRLLALACALLCVVVGNVLRIAGSIAVGLASGTSSLVLFHDWVGSLFGFGYTLGGYLLMLYLLLRAAPAATPELPLPEPALVGTRAR